MKKQIISLLSVIAILFTLTACGQQNKSPDKITVYATVYPLQYLAEQIGGEFVDVKSIYPPGSDAHTFEPTQKIMTKIAESNLFFYVGLGMEGFVDKAKETFKNQDVKFIPLGESLKLPKMKNDEGEEEEEEHHEKEHHHHHHGDINPHVWLSPVYMKQMGDVVKNELSKQMPKQKETFEKNYQLLQEKLTKLNDSYKNLAEHAKKKDFVTAHAAYAYWETEYGFHQIPIAGVSTSDEPSQKKLKEIVNTIKSKKIPYIMLEQNTHSKIAEVIKDETNTKTLTLHNLETLTQKDIDQKRDYISIMKNNLDALKTAFYN